MERSFEDLLTGLSDESEPELDDMIVDGSMDNSNLEVTHGKHTLLAQYTKVSHLGFIDIQTGPLLRLPTFIVDFLLFSLL